MPVWFLSKLCKKRCTVAFSGEGADEIFGGYLTYRANRIAAPLRNLPPAAVALSLRALRFWPASNEKISLEYKLKRLLQGSLMPPERAHVYWNGTFSEAEKATLLRIPLPGALTNILAHLRESLPGDGIAPFLEFDQQYYLPDDILVKSDRVSMAHAVEVRPPFLDHRIIEFAARLPLDFKIRGTRQKYLLKEVMRSKLPAAVVQREKIGFDIPAHDWFRGPLRAMLMETLASAEAEHSGLFRLRNNPYLHPTALKQAHKHRLSLVGADDVISMDETMEHSVNTVTDRQETGAHGRVVSRSQFFWIVIFFAAAVYLGCILSPPSLMDDVDAVQAQIARNMLSSGDWVTARLDGVAYLEKPPLIYWMIAISYKVFGVHDWAARIPIALSAIALCFTTAAFGAWAFGRRAGFYAGLCMSTCIGLFLFTRILVPDVVLTLVIALALWAFLRVLEEEEPHPRAWAAVFAASLGVGLLLKSLIAVVFPVAAVVIYLSVHSTDLLRVGMETTSAIQWTRHHPIDCCAMAHSRHASKSALLQLHDEERSWGIPRILLVFLYQRATPSISQPSLSARLQHGAAALFLAAQSGVALPLERLPASSDKTLLPIR